jgi:phosphoribosylformylglycinamidine synthase II
MVKELRNHPKNRPERALKPSSHWTSKNPFPELNFGSQKLPCPEGIPPLLHRIEVAQKSPSTDSPARRVLTAMREDLGLPAESASLIRVYTLEMNLSPAEAETVGRDLFCDPVTEIFAVDRPLAGRAGLEFDWLIEAGFKPGVTDNVGRSAREGVADALGSSGPSGRILGEDDKVYTGRQVLLRGALTRDQAVRVATALLANPLIETWQVLSRAEWDPAIGIPAQSRKVVVPHQPSVRTIALPEDPAALQKLSDEMLLALTLEEMQTVRAYFADPARAAARRAAGLPADPTDVELEMIAQTWSEHCKHKIFAADVEYTDETGKTEVIHSLYKTFVKAATNAVRPKAPWLKSVFTDNAGIIAFAEGWDVAMKAETHNSPSALDPFGGAMTGIVGVNRDILGCGMGCKPIFNTDVFCFASPYYDKAVPEKLHHPRRLMKEVHRGVKDGGNESGIPTVNGSIVFDDRFLGKPLVFCGTGGLIPSELHGKPSHEKSIVPGDRIVMAGGRIGKDGIHGATFSSIALTEASPVSAVQIGDPITQKKMLDFLLEARDLGLFRFVTDNGAGGLSSSLGEMARESGGCALHLDRAPLKYAGLDPWEILVSEAQERMSFAVPPESWEAFRDLAARRDVEVSDLGTFTDSGFFESYYDGKPVCRMDMDFLHDGNPKLRLKARWTPPAHLDPPEASVAARDFNADALALLGALNICSKETWVRQYDHEVQGQSVVKPFMGRENDGPSDAAVIKPLADRPEGLVVSHGIVPRYSDIDAYHMAAAAVDEAVRNAVAVGGEPGKLAALDNFCWPDPVESPETPDGQYKMAQLVRANQALYDICVAYGLPLISGKDSMKNDYGRGATKISVPPTLMVTVVGPIPDARKTATIDFKRAGDFVYVLGTTKEELGGSEYFAMLGAVGTAVPVTDFAANLALYQRLFAAIQAGLARSVHDCSDGGLWVALAESALGGRLGVDVDMALDPVAPIELELSDAGLLFGESQGRFVVSVAPDKAAAFEKIMAGSACARVGTVTADDALRVRRGTRTLIDTTIEEAFAAWRKPLDF